MDGFQRVRVVRESARNKQVDVGEEQRGEERRESRALRGEGDEGEEGERVLGDSERGVRRVGGA